MKRNMIALCIVFGVCFTASVALTAVSAVYAIVPLIVIGALAALVTLWVFTGSILCERVFEGFEKKFSSGDYLGALRLLDGACANHFFYPLYRTTAHELYAKGELAVDNLSECAKYVELLRHAGGEGWRYRTAFYIVLLNLDWGEYAAAREEFEAFKKACSHSQIYKEQIEALTALFSHIAGERVELPEGVKRSPYPVVGRILMRNFE